MAKIIITEGLIIDYESRRMFEGKKKSERVLTIELSSLGMRASWNIGVRAWGAVRRRMIRGRRGGKACDVTIIEQPARAEH